MIGWVPSVAPSWGGRPVARRIVEAGARQRVVVTGDVVGAEWRVWRDTIARVFVLDDSSGKLMIAFTGVRDVPGMEVGTRCTVEGTVLADEAEPVVWNPFYRFEEAGGSRASRPFGGGGRQSGSSTSWYPIPGWVRR